MAFLNLSAVPGSKYPGGFTALVLGPCVRRRVEVKTAADCEAALAAFVEHIKASGEAQAIAKQFTGSLTDREEVRCAVVSGYIGDRDGRKPNGYKALKLRELVPEVTA